MRDVKNSILTLLRRYILKLPVLPIWLPSKWMWAICRLNVWKSNVLRSTEQETIFSAPNETPGTLDAEIPLDLS